MNKDFWNERYSQKEYSYGKDPNDFLKEQHKVIPASGNILCLCEGEGRNAVFLAKQGHEVFAVDISEKGKEKALELAKENAVTISYDIADLNEYDFGNKQWDAVISISAHLPKDLRLKTYKNIKESLKPQGMLILEGYNKKQLDYETGGPKREDMLFSLDELKDTFADFDILHAEDRIRNVNEGAHHSGAASVTQFICKKVD